MFFILCLARSLSLQVAEGAGWELGEGLKTPWSPDCDSQGPKGSWPVGVMCTVPLPPDEGESNVLT